MTTTHQKALILGPLVPCRVGFHSMASDPWVHVRGGGLKVKSRAPLIMDFLWYSILG